VVQYAVQARVCWALQQNHSALVCHQALWVHCRFVMWYEGVAEDNSRSIGMAVSNDGISGWKRWDRSADFPLINQPFRQSSLQNSKRCIFRNLLSSTTNPTMQSTATVRRHMHHLLTFNGSLAIIDTQAACCECIVWCDFCVMYTLPKFL